MTRTCDVVLALDPMLKVSRSIDQVSRDRGFGGAAGMVRTRRPRSAEPEHVPMSAANRVPRVDNQRRGLKDHLIIDGSMRGENRNAVGARERLRGQRNRRQIAAAHPVARSKMRN